MAYLDDTEAAPIVKGLPSIIRIKLTHYRTDNVVDTRIVQVIEEVESLPKHFQTDVFIQLKRVGEAQVQRPEIRTTARVPPHGIAGGGERPVGGGVAIAIQVGPRQQVEGAAAIGPTKLYSWEIQVRNPLEVYGSAGGG